eukprot:m.9420 g.9420  ORF g.9420 m.9420 type:complete len:769 (-) comp3508_c0_seq2:283-2589(-)
MPPPNIRVLTAAVAVLLVACIAPPASAQIVGFNVVGVTSVEYAGGVAQLETQTEHTLRVFGTGLVDGDDVHFTPSDCGTSLFPTTLADADGTSATLTVSFDEQFGLSDLFFCVNDVLQGTAPEVTVSPFVPSDDDPLIPTGATIVILIVLLLLSGTFSGLNLGLMALDVRELQIFMDAGDEEEKKNAKTILPLRKRGNLLLCTILLGNVLVNSTLTILLDGLAGGIVAVIGSTAGIVVFGEIVPQAICSRHGLWIGAHTIWMTRVFVLITFPIAYPISKVLDLVLGEEVGNVYQRRQLLQLIRLQSADTDLGDQEIEILQGALTYKEKTVEEVMTKIEDVFMLSSGCVLDFKTMSRIMESGHSRIPVYENDRENITGVLHVKDLAFIDPDDRTPLKTVVKYYNHRIEEVYNDAKLDKMLDFFRQGKTHICFVIAITTGDGDPYREVVGIVTLEDVIEEIIQAEIIDETDRIVDNRTKSMVPRSWQNHKIVPKDMGAPNAECMLSEQMMMAAFTFLSTSVEPFSRDFISPTVLRKLLAMPACSRRLIASDLEEADKYIYRAGHTGNSFVLVLEGRLKMRVGKDSLAYDAGPFTTLAVTALQEFSTPFVPDFTAVVGSESVLIFEVSRELYMDALAATRREVMNQGGRGPGGDGGDGDGDGDGSGGAATAASAAAAADAAPAATAASTAGASDAAASEPLSTSEPVSGNDSMSQRHEKSLQASFTSHSGSPLVSRDEVRFTVADLESSSTTDPAPEQEAPKDSDRFEATV